MVVTEPDFLEWKQHSVTQAFLKGLRKEREVLKEQVIHSSFENEDFAKGKAMAILELLEMTYQDYMELGKE